MWEKNLNQKLLLIGVVILFGALLIYPPSEKLRPGLDIAGGVALIFEIDDTGLEGDPTLAEQMKQLLQKRVDPKGVFDIAWRVHGRNRLEVQIPLPPPGVTEKREAYADSLDKLFSGNVTRGEMETAFAMTGDARAAEIARLAHGQPHREQLLTKAAEAFDEYQTALAAYRRGPEAPAESQPTEPAASQPTESAPASQPTSAPAKTRIDLEDDLNAAEDDMDEAYAAFLATNLNRARFLEVLSMDQGSEIRKNHLAEFSKEHPELQKEIEAVVVAHAAWRKNSGYLDGAADLQRLLRGAGVLEFRILPTHERENPTKYDVQRRQLREHGPLPREGTLGWFKVDNPLSFFDLKTPADLAEFSQASTRYVVEKHGEDYYVLAKLSPEDGLLAEKKNWQLRSVSISRDQHGRPCVNFALDVVGGGLFEELTRKNIGNPLCILVDDVAYSAPNIQSKIRSNGQITGDFSREKVTYLAQTMRAGSLPARLRETPISERTIGSSLGATNRDLAFRAGLIGVIVVASFMAMYYLVCGLVADAALVLNIVLVLAIMSLLQARFTLAGIAGVILTIGMSVDANVLIFERMREEKERGSSLRLMLKNGYEKAFSTIVDANITTLLTCVILYYVGSEEIKGFGLTLGWGIVISLFTALFVTRTLFMLLIKYGLLKDIKMLRFIGVPKVDWYAKRKFFIPLSISLVAFGLFLLWERGSDQFLDVEFLGGVSAEIEVKPPQQGEEALDDVEIGELMVEAGGKIAADADKLNQAEVSSVVGDPAAFRVHVPGLTAARLEAILTEPLEDQNALQRGGMRPLPDEQAVIVHMAGNQDSDWLREFVKGEVADVRKAGEEIAKATVGSVMEAGFEEKAGRYWSVTTTEKNRRLVQEALEMALGNRLERQQRITYRFRGDSQERPLPILGQRLDNVFPNAQFPAGVAAEPLIEYRDGAAMFFDDLDPPQSVNPEVSGSLPDRLRNMRLQPGYQEYPFRKFKVIGVRPTEERDDKGGPLYASVVVVVVDENFRYNDDTAAWYQQFAEPELDLAKTALDTEQSFRRVSQFKPQIARRATTQAGMALLLSWAMIIGYLWIRFGRPMFGIAGVVALIHDVCIALAFVGIAGWLGGTKHPIGAALLIDDFKINMTIVAAFLTIIGYSINDTIVVFDRIRETRGRLGQVTPQIINDSINQCMSRTLLTSATTLAILVVMYIFGGGSIRGFNYCMIIGVLTGTYSSVAIAAPLLMVQMHRKKLSPM
ncbi:MAG: protein translocase subunit SecD [Phycisphaerae bacterium]|jgi:SecD/SecF fusion protein